ncbi:CDGSH iron-sulfur domain-containing protein 3, mitochondrial-like [Anneissia japonica]|uniref:CDGSH iron-sulfur domain-containing protein 3, mitochondrial-like n=1 Tax=Anneissia japonica TaxID=1529436 RepID=UPI0014255AA9|nr:CDGSH iron-sulfur domain-containing protein 3, mitochondrial-like [Anneissia japonica]
MALFSLRFQSFPIMKLRLCYPLFRPPCVNSSTANTTKLQKGIKGTYIAKKMPAFKKLEANKRYSWCACGLSQKQPFCDGSHKGTEFKPIRMKFEQSKSVLLCQCKQTSNPPYCDMTHVSVIFSSLKNIFKK